MQRSSPVDGRDYLKKLKVPLFMQTLTHVELDQLFKSLITDDLKVEYFELMSEFHDMLDRVQYAKSDYIRSRYKLYGCAKDIKMHLIKEFGVLAFFSKNIGKLLNGNMTDYASLGLGFAQLYVLQESLVNNCEPEVLSSLNELIKKTSDRFSLGTSGV